jgi:hypothetical protein
MRSQIDTRTHMPAASTAAHTACAGHRIPRPPRTFLLLVLVILAACKSPTQEEIIERQSGVYALAAAAGAAPPLVEMRGSTRLEILSGNITLSSHFTAPGWRACSFTLAFRETEDSDAVHEGTETVACRFGSIIGHTLHFQLEEGAERTRRFENMAHDATRCSWACIEGQLGGDYTIRITDRTGTPFVFRK